MLASARTAERVKIFVRWMRSLQIDGTPIIIPCYNKPFGCNNSATDRHHCFSQTKHNVKKYGRKVIDSKQNIRYFCNNCHASHRKVPKWLIWDEITFLQRLHDDDRDYLNADYDPANIK